MMDKAFSSWIYLASFISFFLSCLESDYWKAFLSNSGSLRLLTNSRNGMPATSVTTSSTYSTCSCYYFCSSSNIKLSGIYSVSSISGVFSVSLTFSFASTFGGPLSFSPHAYNIFFSTSRCVSILPR